MIIGYNYASDYVNALIACRTKIKRKEFCNNIIDTYYKNSNTFLLKHILSERISNERFCTLTYANLVEYEILPIDVMQDESIIIQKLNDLGLIHGLDYHLVHTVIECDQTESTQINSAEIDIIVCKMTLEAFRISLKRDSIYSNYFDMIELAFEYYLDYKNRFK